MGKYISQLLCKIIALDVRIILTEIVRVCPNHCPVFGGTVDILTSNQNHSG